MKKLDRRVVRTRKLLQETLLALIVERGYESITVQDITDRANLARATFYLHYKDKEELLVTTLQAGYDELVEKIEFPRPGQPISLPTPIGSVFEHVAQNKHLYRVILLSGAGRTAALRRTRDYMKARSLAWLKLVSQSAQVPLDFASAYMAGSLLNMVAWWLEHDMPYPPKEMEQMFLQLSVDGVARTVGIDATILDEWRKYLTQEQM